MTFVPMRDGSALHVRVVGKGQPVLMLPGLGMASAHWLPFVLPHAGRFRFYMPDFRGHGPSRHLGLSQPDVFESHARDVQDVVAHFGLTDYLLAGISLGATTALHVRQQTAFEGVRGYLHIDQSPNVLNGPDWTHGLAGERQADLFRHMRAALRVLDQHPDVAYFDELPVSVRVSLGFTLSALMGVLGASPTRVRIVRRVLPSLPERVARRVPLLRLDDMRAYLTAYSGGGHDYRPALSHGDVPVTLMVGMNSPLYAPAGQELVATRAKRGQVVRFERSGHAPLLDEPRKFVREFARFLQQQPA